jgi:hypothetical protein
VGGKEFVEPGNPEFQKGRAKPKVDNARVGLAVTKHQFAKIAVVRDQYSLFSVRDCQDFPIG